MKACRTCLKILYDEAEYHSVDSDDCNIQLPSLRSKLLTCVPELTLDIIQCAVICGNCIEALNIAFNFKNQCLQTEEKISNFTRYNGTNSVNIIDVLQQDFKQEQTMITFTDIDIKPVYSDESNDFLQPQVTIKEGETFIHKADTNVPYSPEFDIEIKNSEPLPETHTLDENLKADLLSGLLSYNEIKPFKCTVCEKSFVRKDKLSLHTRIHTGEKPFQCPYCGRSFSRKDKMNNHIRTHTREKPFHCIFCQKAFARKDRMNSHMRSQHHQAMSNLEITVVKPTA